MEELLNKLIEKGWKPRGEEEIKSCQIWESFYKRKFIEDMVWFYTDDRGTPQWLFTKSLREVCSKSSWLWQFVCENKLQPTNRSGGWEYSDGYTWWTCMAYQFRLIESSLKDEDELEEFLLSNIKVWNED